MPKKKQKRYESEKAILKAIDAMEATRILCLENAEAWDGSLKTVRPETYPNEEEYISQIDYLRKMAGAARRSAQRIDSKKAKLGKALSRFRTMLLPIPENDDESVVL